MLESTLNIIFSPIIGLNPALGIAIICAIITGILTFLAHTFFVSINIGVSQLPIIDSFFDKKVPKYIKF